jgi:hypothetical protein
MNISSRWLRKKCVDNGDGDEGNDSSSSSSSSSSNNTYIPKYYLLNVFNNSFPNIKLEPATTQETENVIIYLKPKNTHGYDEIPANLLNMVTNNCDN